MSAHMNNDQMMLMTIVLLFIVGAGGIAVWLWRNPIVAVYLLGLSLVDASD